MPKSDPGVRTKARISSLIGIKSKQDFSLKMRNLF
jgi:hypothetical protein